MRSEAFEGGGLSHYVEYILLPYAARLFSRQQIAQLIARTYSAFGSVSAGDIQRFADTTIRTHVLRQNRRKLALGGVALDGAAHLNQDHLITSARRIQSEALQVRRGV
jgi:hypothetical protein